MRNLKRVLSLALATAMLFSMMVIGASAANKTAADLTDMDKVTNKEAVTLLVDLGIIVGKPDGSYAPAEIVNRATMAKLITYIMMGDVDPKAFTGTVTPLKDISGHWAEGYIKYCFANGLVAGDGTNFYPDKEVTTVEASKMLLVALGYDAKDRGYENSASWSVNIMKDAQQMNLLTDLGTRALDGLSRDNAAQMIYNALFAQTVKSEYSRDINGERYVSKVTVTTAATDKLGYITYGLTANVGPLTATATAALNGTVAAKDSIRIGSSAINKLTASVDLLGQQVVYYTGRNGKLISSSVVATGKSVVTTDTEGKAYATFIKDNSLTVAGGSIYSDYTQLAASIAAPNAGDVVKYIDHNNDGTVDYIVLTAYELGKVTKTTAASGSTKATVTVQGAGTYNIDEVEGVSDLEKDDLVLFAQVGNSLLVEAPETIDGTISAYKGGNGAVTAVTVDGTNYKTSNIPVNVTGVTNGSSVKTTATASSLLKSAGTFYLDKAGTIVYYVKTTEGTNSYAYLLSAKMTPPGFGSEGEAKYEAYVILADGTKATYELTKTSAFGKDNWAADSLVGGTVSSNVYTPNTPNNIFKYGINSDGKLTLTAATNNSYVVGTNPNAKVEKNKAQLSVNTAGAPTVYSAVANAYMNKDTVFMFYDAAGTGKTVTMVTGFENIPASTTVAGNKISFVKNATTNVVEIVFLETAAVTQSDKAYAYATGAAATNTSDGVEYEFVIDGQIKTLLVSSALSGGNSYSIDKLYTYTTDNKGVSTVTAVTVGTAAGEVVQNAEVKAVAGNYVIVDAGAGDVVVYLADKYTVDTVLTSSNGVITKPGTGSLAVGDTISYTTVASGSDAGKLIKAYVVPTPELEDVRLSVNGATVTATLVGARNGTASYAWTSTGTTTATTTDSSAVITGAPGTYTVDLTVTYTSRTGVVVTVTATQASVTIPTP